MATTITMTHPDLPDREIEARSERQADVYAKSGWQRKGQQRTGRRPGPESEKPKSD